ncbi:hypothetical protein D9M70_573180 [compost metagenome]
MAEGVVQLLEVVQVAEQQRGRLTAFGAHAQQAFAGIHEGAAVAGASQRIAEGRRAELQLGTFLDHRQRGEGHADGEQHGFEDQEGEEGHPALRRRSVGQVPVQQQAHAIHAGVQEQENEDRPQRNLQPVSAAP